MVGPPFGIRPNLQFLLMAQCLKITEKVSFNNASEARYAYLHLEWTKVFFFKKCPIYGSEMSVILYESLTRAKTQLVIVTIDGKQRCEEYCGKYKDIFGQGLPDCDQM